MISINISLCILLPFRTSICGLALRPRTLWNRCKCVTLLLTGWWWLRVLLAPTVSGD